MSEDKNRAQFEREVMAESDSPELKQRQRVQSRRFGRDFQSLGRSKWMGHVRKRPAMYFGDSGSLGKQTIVTELVSNSVDQFLAKKATLVSVSIIEDWIEIKDDGEGYPLNIYRGDHSTSYGEDLLCHMKTYEDPAKTLAKMEAIQPEADSSQYDASQIKVVGEDYLTRVHVTPTADNHAPHIHLSYLNGVGVAPVNAVCQNLVVQAWRGRELWEQRFSKGIPLCDPFMVKRGEGRGTTWRFQLDEEIFEEDPIDLSVLKRDFQHAACVFPGLSFILQDEHYHSSKGLLDLCKQLSKVEQVESWSYQCIKDEIRIDAAAVGRSDESQLLGYANGRRCWDGGTHVDGLREALALAGWKPEVAVIHVLFENPQFAGSNATKLGNDAIRKTVREALLEPLREYMSSSPKSP